MSRLLSSTLLPFLVWVSLLKLNIRKTGTLIIKGLLRCLGIDRQGITEQPSDAA